MLKRYVVAIVRNFDSLVLIVIGKILDKGRKINKIEKRYQDGELFFLLKINSKFFTRKIKNLINLKFPARYPMTRQIGIAVPLLLDGDWSIGDVCSCATWTIWQFSRNDGATSLRQRHLRHGHLTVHR